MITFHVSGVPAPQGSKTAMPVRKNGKLTGKTNLVESSKALKPWRTLVTHQARRAKPKGFTPYAGAVRVEVIFRFPRPKGHYGTTKHELIIGTATLETEKAWGGEVLTQTFEAEFEATPKETIL